MHNVVLMHHIRVNRDFILEDREFLSKGELVLVSEEFHRTTCSWVDSGGLGS